MDFERQRKRLIEYLVDEGHLRGASVKRAMLEVPREDFVPSTLRRRAYDDTPLEIGHGQTISAPHMVAIMADALSARPGWRVLEVGTGSGYHAAVLSRLVGPTGHVVSVEQDPELAAEATQRLATLGFRNIEVHAGDGSRGWPQGAPYDAATVTCAARRVPPALLDQVRDGGIVLAPVGRAPSRLVRARREGEDVTTEDLGPCAFVPLLGEEGFE